MQIAIVTGASSGIGRSTAVQIAAQGSGVILTYRGHEAGARDAVAEIEKTGGTAVALPLDVGDTTGFAAFRDAVTRALRDTWQRDTFDALVNNAGVGGLGTMFADTTEDEYDRFHRVLLKGPYFLTQALLPLLADGGAIVNVSSSSTSGAHPGYSAYASMKGGLTVLGRYLAKELSERGIRVNTVSPGPTRTRLGDDGFTRYPEVIPAIAARTALGRIGEPDDVGAVVAMLTGPESRWITAQDIEVSGGYDL